MTTDRLAHLLGRLTADADGPLDRKALDELSAVAAEHGRELTDVGRVCELTGFPAGTISLAARKSACNETGWTFVLQDEVARGIILSETEDRRLHASVCYADGEVVEVAKFERDNANSYPDHYRRDVYQQVNKRVPDATATRCTDAMQIMNREKRAAATTTVFDLAHAKGRMVCAAVPVMTTAEFVRALLTQTNPGRKSYTPRIIDNMRMSAMLLDAPQIGGVAPTCVVDDKGNIDVGVLYCKANHGVPMVARMAQVTCNGFRPKNVCELSWPENESRPYFVSDVATKEAVQVATQLHRSMSNLFATTDVVKDIGIPVRTLEELRDIAKDPLSYRLLYGSCLAKVAISDVEGIAGRDSAVIVRISERGCEVGVMHFSDMSRFFGIVVVTTVIREDCVELRPDPQPLMKHALESYPFEVTEEMIAAATKVANMFLDRSERPDIPDAPSREYKEIEKKIYNAKVLGTLHHLRVEDTPLFLRTPAIDRPEIVECFKRAMDSAQSDWTSLVPFYLSE